MAYFWKRPRASRLAGKKLLSKQNSQIELTIPTHFRCPISLDLMKDPVTLSTGITYDRESIEKWIQNGNETCPVTNQVLTSFDLIPNHSIRRMIQDWCVENRAHGVERIPTPRIPITPFDVVEICSKMIISAQNGDAKRFQIFIEKIKLWAKESERNKNLIKENGLGYVLSSAFDSFSRVSIEKNEGALKEILFLLTWMFPLGSEGQAKLGSTPSLRCIAWFLHGDDLCAQKTAALALKELLSSDQKHVRNLIEIEGVPEALIKIIRKPICSSTTKSCLAIIYYIVSTPMVSNHKMSSRFLDLGVVESSIEVLVEADKGTSEMALGVLDCICGLKEGKERLQKHALAVPLMVKKILRVSSLATEFCVSILWKLGMNNNGSCMVEAVHVGAFQKLLLMLQVNCDEGTKIKATEMLKLMNHYKSKLDCFDSNHYKYLIKSF